MNWRDLFYFSKGERRALIVILSLVIIGWITIALTRQGILFADSERKNTGFLYPVCIYPVDSHIQTSKEPYSPPPPVVAKATPKATPAPDKQSILPRTPTYKKVEKYPWGTIVELNTADTLALQKVPGIGSTYSRRIVKYRDLLGGFYSVAQLSEVYGIDADRYNQLKEWFCVNPHLIQKRAVNRLPSDSLARHPYINYRQARAIQQLCRRKGKLTGWENIQLLEEFSDHDRTRIEPYLSFE